VFGLLVLGVLLYTPYIPDLKDMYPAVNILYHSATY